MAEVRIPICLVCGSDLPRGGGQCGACARTATKRAAAHGIPADTPLPAPPSLTPLAPPLVPAAPVTMLTLRPRATGPAEPPRRSWRIALAVGLPFLLVLAFGWSTRGPSSLTERIAQARLARLAAGQTAGDRAPAGADADRTGAGPVVTQPYSAGTGRPPDATVPQVSAGPGPDVVVDTTLPAIGTDPTAPLTSADGSGGTTGRDRDREGSSRTTDPSGGPADDPSDDGAPSDPGPPDVASQSPLPDPGEAPPTATTAPPSSGTTPASSTTTPSPTTTRPSTTTSTTSTTAAPPPPTTTDPPTTTTEAPPPPPTDPPPTDPPADPPPDPGP